MKNIPPIEKFSKFLAGIWEDNKTTVETKWMREVGERIKNKIGEVSEFYVTEGNIKTVIKKRKNWTAPGVDGIQNYWWKMFSATWGPMSRVMSAWVKDQRTIPEWIAIGQTVLIIKVVQVFSGLLHFCRKLRAD